MNPTVTGSATSRKAERATDLWRSKRPVIESMFAPRSVAVIGASEKPGTVGRTLLENLRAGSFHGKVYPINPRYREVQGLHAFPSIASVPERVDLAVVATPAATVPAVIAECRDAGVKGCVIISAGFKESGPAGVEMERQVLANRGTMRIIGPNCLGVMLPHLGLNATFAAGIARPGSVGFLSQSGALCTAVLDWSQQTGTGFSAFVSVGSMADVNWGDLLYYLGDDPHTKSIVIYMESVGDARTFLSAAREVALAKPIVVLKVGRTADAARAAASHTGSLTGRDDVLDAAFQRAGVLRVGTIGEMFAMADVLGKQPRPCGPKLGIVTNAGGPGGLATDALITSGGELSKLSEASIAALNQVLPAHWSHGNPVDVLGDADAARYGRAAEIVAKDPGCDGLLVILTPQAMTDSPGTAEALARVAAVAGKPVLASWMGGPAVAPGEAILNRAGIPVFSQPDAAAQAFAAMWRYSYHLRSLYETPSLPPGAAQRSAAAAGVGEMLRAVRAEERTILTEPEAKRVLAAYGIPVCETRTAADEEAAVRAAGEIGYPVVLKLWSETVTHKTDVGGVKLGLRNARAVRAAWRAIRKSAEEHGCTDGFRGVTVQAMASQRGYEVILGSSLDPQFGPVLLFGAGGELVEVFHDRSLGLPPLNATLARRMMEQTRVFKALQGVRGRRPVDIEALAQLLVRFSILIAEQPLIREVDINPLLASPEGFVVLDARVIVHDHSVALSRLPQLAIRPYPTQYISRWKLRDGAPVVIRPIRPEDESMMVEFHHHLSMRSVRFRYFGSLNVEQRIAHERLTRICFCDYDREIALVAERKIRRTGQREIIGVGRLSKLHHLNGGEFALLIADAWQGRGLGTRLLRLLVEIGRREKLDRIIGHILPDNLEMQRVAAKVGFTLTPNEVDEEVIAEIALSHGACSRVAHDVESG